MKEKEKQSKALYILYIDISILHTSISISLSLLQWMQGNIYREVFPTFLAKKSYGWWITRRRMEIYTKYLKWSRQKQSKIRTTHGVCEIFAHLRGVCEFRTPFAHLSHTWSSCLPKAISSSFQLQIVHGLKSWILDFLIFEMVYSM